MNQLIDETGHTYGRLQVLSRAANRRRTACWNCICKCGKKAIVSGGNLRNGSTVSCGCRQAEIQAEMAKYAGIGYEAWLAGGGREQIREWNTKHGHANSGKLSSTYRSWQHMKTRCLNPKNDAYPYYGGRGIAVCEEWINSFETFLVDMGERPSLELSLDRIDNDGHYEPGNCRWTSKSTQSSNQRKRRIRRSPLDITI